MEDGKKWWASKTMWVNGLGLVAVIAGAFGIDLGVDEETKTKIAVGFIAAINIVLRLVTSKPIA